VVNDWKLSEHSSLGIGCDSCHGSEHLTPTDAAKLPTVETCGQRHADRLEQFKKGKHALAWAAMEAMPTIHYQPIDGNDGRNERLRRMPQEQEQSSGEVLLHLDRVV
jgi:hypothetical protein